MWCFVQNFTERPKSCFRFNNHEIEQKGKKLNKQPENKGQLIFFFNIRENLLIFLNRRVFVGYDYVAVIIFYVFYFV